MAIAISFVVFGTHTREGAIFWKLYKRDAVDAIKPIDVRYWLDNDPSSAKKWGCSHNDKGSSFQCQANLLNQKSLMDAVSGIWDFTKAAISDAREAGTHVKIAPVYCTAGSHRSDGCTTMLKQSVVNLMRGDGGHRLYNANVLRLTVVTTFRKSALRPLLSV